MAAEGIENPILNGPYDPPAAHFELGPHGPTGIELPGRRCPRIPCYTDPVANLTLQLDDEVLRRARIRALERNTSINALVREYLTHFAGADPQLEARHRLVDHARRHAGGSGDLGRTWTRDDLHER